MFCINFILIYLQNWLYTTKLIMHVKTIAMNDPVLAAVHSNHSG